jgi:integrase
MSDYRLQRFRGGWAVAEYRDGKRVSRRGLDAGDAADAAEKFRQVVEAAKRPSTPTVSALWEAYRADRAGRRIAENMEWSGKPILAFFGGQLADSISVARCRDYVADRRKAKKHDGTIWTELGHLRIVLKWAEKLGYGRAPFIERPRKPPPKDRHLTRAEFDRLKDQCKAPHLRLFVELAIATAARKEALLTLTWDRVRFDRGHIELGQPNAIRPQKGRATVPMTDTLRAALSEAHTGARTDYVIEYGGRAVKSVRTGLEAASSAAKVGHVTPHMFRHSAAVWMAQEGVEMRKIAQFLGHSDERTTARIYALYSPDYLRDAAAALETGKLRSALRSA